MAALAGKVAVVTGATSGIGAEIARRFVAEGAQVVLSGRRTEQGEALAAELGDAAVFVQADVSLDDEVENLIRSTVDRAGRLDVLVNNAGMSADLGPLAETDMAHFRSVFAVNVCGPLLGMKFAAPHMRDQGSGSIINIGSVAGIRTAMSGLDYSVSKAALIHLTRWAAAELGQYGIRVNSISPGFVLTGIFAKAAGHTGEDADAEQAVDAVAEAARGILGAISPTPRPGGPEDVAEAAVFLAGDAASYVNGHDLVVDGGHSVGQPYSVMREQRARVADAVAAVMQRS